MNARHDDLLDNLYDIAGVPRRKPGLRTPFTWEEFKSYVESMGVRDNMLVGSICVYPEDIKNDTVVVDIYPEGQREPESDAYFEIY